MRPVVRHTSVVRHSPIWVFTTWNEKISIEEKNFYVKAENRKQMHQDFSRFKANALWNEPPEKLLYESKYILIGGINPMGDFTKFSNVFFISILKLNKFLSKFANILQTF